MKAITVFLMCVFCIVYFVTFVPWLWNTLPPEMRSIVGDIKLLELKLEISPETQRSLLSFLFIYIIAQTAVVLHELTFHRGKKETHA